MRDRERFRLRRVAPRFLDALFVENTERVYHSHIILGGWRVYEGVPPSPLAIPYAKGKQGVVKIEPTGEEPVSYTHLTLPTICSV